MPKQYFFQAGTFRDLSYTELTSVFKIYGLNRDIIHTFSDSIFLIKSNDISEDLLRNIFNRLGGFIRFGELIEDTDSFLNEYLNQTERIVFGLSIIGEANRGDNAFLKKLGSSMKKVFRESNISSRFLFPQGKDTYLNAAQLINNDILDKGFELCILRNGKEEIYARTLMIQDLEGYVERDMDRPYADMEMGVLPPKLARMMVNFASIKDGTVWDPFCGSGTILMESALLGYNFLGSDIDENALAYSEGNIKWLNEKGYLGNIVYEIFKLDVMNPEHDIVKKLKKTNISAIVCEPFMGPPQKKILSEEHANNLLSDVKDLYSNLFNLLDEEIGVRGIKMVIVIPSYRTVSGWKTFGVRDILTNRWEVQNKEYSSGKDLKWSRKNSIITRNIFILHRT